MWLTVFEENKDELTDKLRKQLTERKNSYRTILIICKELKKEIEKDFK